MTREKVTRLKQVDMLQLYEAMKNIDFGLFTSDQEVYNFLTKAHIWGFDFTVHSVRTIRNSMGKELAKPIAVNGKETLKVLITSLYSLYQTSQQPIPNDLIALFKSVSK